MFKNGIVEAQNKPRIEQSGFFRARIYGKNDVLVGCLRRLKLASTFRINLTDLSW